ncbi:hypothetical protein NQZ68_034561 [Dissostichus eleginoides]|nr:hypothetical protein NQZ68_034561 [Dissostichus eleginoides]
MAQGNRCIMGKIVFYEERNFCGRQFEYNQDCADLSCVLKQCSSIRVESGCFMIYDQPNFSGNQYCLKKGEYPDCQHWMGTDSVFSCRLISMDAGAFSMRLYQRIEFGGQMMDLADDCPSVHERFHLNDIFSCNVTNGNWLFYEHPDFQGRMYLIRRGEYMRFSEWGGRSARVGSIRRILDY